MVVARHTLLEPLSEQFAPNFLHIPSSHPGTTKPNGVESPQVIFASI